MQKRLRILLTCLAAFAASHLSAQDHLLITEFVVTPTAGEFIEIYNPTDQTIDLSNYYVTDATFAGGDTYYYNTVLGDGGGGGFNDFNARFPDGASIAPGEFQTISLPGSDDFMSEYGILPTYELYEDGDAADDVPDMRDATEGSIAGPDNSPDRLSSFSTEEVLILYYWDGNSDLVQDVDYVVWGDKSEAVDKTGVSVDGPDDGEEASTYADDTSIADQTVVDTENDGDGGPHDFGNSAQRKLEVEDLEEWSGGNGITGHNETSENTSWKGGIWSINEPPTPGRRALTPYAPADSLTIADVQFVRAADIGPNAEDDSPFTGDTLEVTGVMMQGARDIFLGSRWGGFIQDLRGGPWSGFFIIQNDTSGDGVEGTLITAAEPGDLIRAKGVMSEFPIGPMTPSISQFALITSPVTPIEFIEFGVGLPDTILLTPGDLGSDAGGNGADPQLSERWESTLVRFEGLTVLANGLPGNTLSASDESGTIILDDYFNAVSTTVTNNAGVWPGLPPGTQINVVGFVRGGSSQGFVTINPRSLDDIEIASAPPEISNISRDPVVPTSADAVTISATITDAQTAVASANLQYRVDGGAFTSMAMTDDGGGSWSSSIPAQTDGAFIEFFLEAADDQGDATTAPGDTSMAKFFYFVRDGGLTIKDVQFVPNPTASDASSFANLEVTVTGIVTTDTTDFSFYWIQDGTDPWSGVWINDNVNQVVPGDEVTVTGTVQENFGATRINATNVVVNSSGNPVPEPVIVQTGDIRTGGSMAEAYEGMLIQTAAVTVSNPFADGGSNFGEFVIDDGSGGVRVDDLGNFRGNLDTLFTQDQNLMFVRGVHHYSFNQHKIEPRNDMDIGFDTAVGDDILPETFDLAQNYPNPFNPSTSISYSVAQASNVQITIYNIMGQRVRTLIDNTKAPGRYTIQWNATNDAGLRVSSGVYFYKMIAGDFVRTNKMLLMK